MTTSFDPTRRRFVLRAAGTAAFALGGSQLLAACGDADDVSAPGTSASSTTTTAGGGASTTAASTTSTSTVERVALTAMMPFAASLGYFLHLGSKTRGHFDAEQLDVDIQFARGAGQAAQALLAGQADISQFGVLNLVQAVTGEGAELTSIAMTAQRLLYRLVSSPEAPIETVEDLPGHRIGLPSLGGNAEDTLRMVMNEAGLDPASVELVPAGFDAAGYGLIEQGQIDGLFTSNDIAILLRHEGIETVEADFGRTNPLLGQVLVLRDEYLAANPDVAVRYLRAMDRTRAEVEDPAKVEEFLTDLAQDWDIPALADLEAAKKILADNLALAYADGPDTFLRHVPQRWAAGMEGLGRIGVVPTGLEPTSFYTNEPLDEALAG